MSRRAHPGPERVASAVDRRGRAVSIQVTVSPLMTGPSVTGAALVMAAVDDRRSD
jgi:hypothetical protein